LPEKVEGAEMTCKGCGTELICHMSNYKGDFKNKLQWQNEDGKAHYATTNGKDFTCNIPETDENEIELKNIPKTTEQETITASNPQEQLNNLTNDEMITRTYDMVKQMYHDYVDTKLTEVKQD